MSNTEPRELAVLRCCARPALSAEHIERLSSLLAQPIDWPVLIGLAQRHRMLPVMARHLRFHAAAAIPADVDAALRQIATAMARRSLCLAAELKRILLQFRSSGIDAIPIKGPILGLSTYGDLALRPCGDLDILVRRSALAEAIEAMETMGFRAAETDPDKPGGLDPRMFETDYHIRMVHQAAGTVVELHWKLTPLGYFEPLDADRVWEQRQTISFQGEPVSTLALEHELFFLCMHGLKHTWEQLEWLVGVGAVMAKIPAESWPDIVDKARRAGYRRTLLYSLALVHALLGTELPKAIETELHATRGIDELVRVTEARIVSSEPWPVVAKYRLHLALQETMGARLAMLFRVATTPGAGDWSGLDLPPHLGGFYRWRRPFRLLRAYLRPGYLFARGKSDGK